MITRLVVFASFLFVVGAMLGPAERPLASILGAIALAAIGTRAYLRGRRRSGALFAGAGALLAGFVATAWRMPREDAISPMLEELGDRAVVLEGIVAEAPELGLEADALIVDVERLATSTVAGAPWIEARARLRVRVPHAVLLEAAAAATSTVASVPLIGDAHERARVPAQSGAVRAAASTVAGASPRTAERGKAGEPPQSVDVPAAKSTIAGGRLAGERLATAGAPPQSVDVPAAKSTIAGGPLAGERLAKDVGAAIDPMRPRPAPVASARDRVRIVAQLHALHPPLMPLLRSRKLAVRRGVALAASASSCTVIEDGSTIFDRARLSIAAAISRNAPPSSAPLLRAFATGDRTGLRYSDEAQFLRAGLSHLFVVGAAYAAAMIFALRALLRDRRWAMIPIAVLLALAYGTSPAILRSLAVIIAVLAFPAHLWIALSASVVLCLAIDPAALGDVAFQIPFAAFAAAIRTRTALATWWGTRAKLLRESAAFCAAVAIGVAPLVARMFDHQSLTSLAWNAILLPWIGFLIAPLALAGGVIGTLSDTLSAPILALAAAATAPVRAIAALSTPLSFPTPTMLECILFYGATISFSMPLRPEGERLRWLTPRRAGLIFTLALLVAIAASTITTRSRETIRAAFLPVNEGAAVLIELPNGEAIGFTTARPSAGLDLGERTLANYAKLRRHASLRAIYVATLDAGAIESARDLSHQLDAREIWWAAREADVPNEARAGFAPPSRFLGDQAELDAAGTRVALHPSGELHVGDLSLHADGDGVARDQAIDANDVRRAGLIVVEVGETVTVRKLGRSASQ